jgi:hypothetical protein
MVTAILSLGKLEFETCSQRCDRGTRVGGGAGSDRRARPPVRRRWYIWPQSRAVSFQSGTSPSSGIK